MALSTTVERRSFVIGAAALTTVVVAEMSLASTRTPALATTTTTALAWTLNTDNWSSARGYPLRTHCKCSACVSHAANKIFATLSAAQDSHLRAHPGCLCEPEQIELPNTVWETLFTTVAVVDRRDPTVAAALAAGDSTAPVSTAPVSTAPVSTAPVSTPPVSTPPVSTAPVSLRPAARHSSTRPAVTSPHNTATTTRTSRYNVPAPAGAPAVTKASVSRPGQQRVSPGPVRKSASSGVLGESAAVSDALGAGSRDGDLEWLPLPVLAVFAGLGLLICWRRRGDQETETTTNA